MAVTQPSMSRHYLISYFSGESDKLSMVQGGVMMQKEELLCISDDDSEQPVGPKLPFGLSEEDLSILKNTGKAAWLNDKLIDAGE